MARPKKNDDKLVPLTVMLKKEHIDEIKLIAEAAELTAGKLARNCILLGLDEVRVMHKLGLARLVGSSRRALEKIKKKFNIETEF